MRTHTGADKELEDVPEALIYEMVDGDAIFYRHYEKVLSNEMSVEQIMGSGFLQARLAAIIVGLLFAKLDLNTYVIVTNGAGFQYGKKSWRALDIAIFDKEKVGDDLFSNRYIRTATKVALGDRYKSGLEPIRRYHRLHQ